MPKRHQGRSEHSNRYTAAQVQAWLAAEPGPVSWRRMVALAEADGPRQITQLRQMLKGMQRNGQLQRDHQGHYHLSGGTGVYRARVQKLGKGLAVDGTVIEDAQRFNLREGDLVEASGTDEVRILSVVEHSPQPVVGVLSWQGRTAFVDGVGGFRGRIRLLEPPLQGDHGDSVAVQIVDRDRRGLVGIVSEHLPARNVLQQAIETAVAGGSIPHEWPAGVTSAVQRLPRRVYANRHPSRRDLTGMALVTIDGESARDFDDAVFAERLSGGRWRLLVAIADVAHYVKSGSALDQEAQLRGTSVYFPQRVIPMLPEEISNGLCSLQPDTPRLALVCEMLLSRNGAVREHQFYEAVIHSRARLTYTQVQQYLDGNLPAAELPVAADYRAGVCESVQSLQQVFQRLRAQRERRGALDFATREGDVRLNEAGSVREIVPVQRNQAHQLIEEAMIAANVCAAEFLEANNQPSLYRVHEPPDPDKLEELRQALAVAGVRLPGGALDPAALQRAMQDLPDHQNGWLYAQLALRSLQQAVYTPVNRGHFGLALQRYMHFTSPIRRYPDLLVHRAIKSTLAAKSGKKAAMLPGGDELHYLGELCSSHERRAESAGWVVDGWLKCDFLRREIGNTLPGIVAGVTEFGLFVELENYFIQGLLHVSSLGSDYFSFQPRSLALVGERSGRRFRLGDALQVQITDIEPAQGRINLQLPQSGGQRRGRGRRPRG